MAPVNRLRNLVAQVCTAEDHTALQGGVPTDRLPIYTEEEVAQHCRTNDFWVTYRDHVYDLTDYIKSHPGRLAFIVRAAGSSVDQWFEHWGAHHDSWSTVQKVLKSHIIGKLDKKGDPKGSEKKDFGLWNSEPHEERLAMKVNKIKPFEAEPHKLPFSFLTPKEHFFVRNHRPCPVYKRYDELSGKDLAKLVIENPETDDDFMVLASALQERAGQVDLPVLLQCTGNRIGELVAHKTVGTLSDVGLGKNYMANACWTGVRLTDLVSGFLFENEQEKISFVAKYPFMEVTGADGFRVGVPTAHALDADNDVILAHRMNGEIISRDHGFPMRFIAPGLPSARSVKFPTKIKFLQEDSDSPWQRAYYCRDGIPLYGFPVTGIITSHGGRMGDERTFVGVAELPLEVQGVAHAGHGLYDELRGAVKEGRRRTIASVMISLDQGRTWTPADLLDALATATTGVDAVLQKFNRFPGADPDKWAWKRWSARISEDAVRQNGRPHGSSNAFELDVWCKATDNEGNMQPEQISEVHKGDLYYNNSVDKVTILVEL